MALLLTGVEDWIDRGRKKSRDFVVVVIPIGLAPDCEGSELLDMNGKYIFDAPVPSVDSLSNFDPPFVVSSGNRDCQQTFSISSANFLVSSAVPTLLASAPRTFSTT